MLQGFGTFDIILRGQREKESFDSEHTCVESPEAVASLVFDLDFFRGCLAPAASPWASIFSFSPAAALKSSSKVEGLAGPDSKLSLSSPPPSVDTVKSMKCKWERQLRRWAILWCHFKTSIYVFKRTQFPKYTWSCFSFWGLASFLARRVSVSSSGFFLDDHNRTSFTSTRCCLLAGTSLGNWKKQTM